MDKNEIKTILMWLEMMLPVKTDELHAGEEPPPKMTVDNMTFEQTKIILNWLAKSTHSDALILNIRKKSTVKKQTYKKKDPADPLAPPKVKRKYVHKQFKGKTI